MNNINGWIVLDKSSGISSAKAVSIIKRFLKVKKVGHIGTLDPLASGVLPVAIGEATKTIPYIKNLEKKYEFTISWGQSRTTDDSEGKVIETNSYRPSRDEIECILPKFLGIIEQVPPKFSALKVNGERAYKLARKGLKFSLLKRKIEIKSIHVTSIINKDTACFEVTCGNGTYIRSLARDIAKDLRTLGYLAYLRRIKVGQFSEKNAFPIQKDINEGDKLEVINNIMPVDKVLKSMPEVNIKIDFINRIKNGLSLPIDSLSIQKKLGVEEGKMIKVKHEGMLVSIATIKRGYIIPRRNFNIEKF